MSLEKTTNWFHRYAISTICVAMVTLIFGALTTSKNAGMAFRDWPTSDGQMMLTYPWLSDFAKNWDKFLEHGHRLAGALIGMWSIGLVTFAFRSQQRRSVKILSFLVLLGVICQGLLGGFRVQLNERGLAMLHGAFAALVLSLMSSVVLLTGRRWTAPDQETDRGLMRMLQGFALLLVTVLTAQYLLGGMIRHQGTGLHEHLIFGFVALGLIFMNWTFSASSNSAWLQRSGLTLLAIALVQVMLGAGAWVLRFGFSPTGFVAVHDSIQQVALRTAHTVWGIVTFQAAIVHLLRVFRVASVSEFAREPELVLHHSDQAVKLIVKGGDK